MAFTGAVSDPKKKTPIISISTDHIPQSLAESYRSRGTTAVKLACSDEELVSKLGNSRIIVIPLSPLRTQGKAFLGALNADPADVQKFEETVAGSDVHATSLQVMSQQGVLHLTLIEGEIFTSLGRLTVLLNHEFYGVALKSDVEVSLHYKKSVKSASKICRLMKQNFECQSPTTGESAKTRQDFLLDMQREISKNRGYLRSL